MTDGTKVGFKDGALDSKMLRTAEAWSFLERKIAFLAPRARTSSAVVSWHQLEVCRLFGQLGERFQWQGRQAPFQCQGEEVGCGLGTRVLDAYEV